MGPRMGLISVGSHSYLPEIPDTEAACSARNLLQGSRGTRLGKDYARNKGTHLKNFTKLGNTWYRADRRNPRAKLKTHGRIM